jgi:hypothetical protein
MVPAVTMPAAVPAMMTSPPDFGGVRFGILLHCRSGAGIAERQRLRAFGRSGKNEQCADGGKPQNFRHLHLMVSLVILYRIGATQFGC